MKKSPKRTFSRSLAKAVLQGLAVFAVFGMAVYVYAIAYPLTQPNPVSGVVGLYVGRTAGTYTGAIGSYQTANNYCDTVESDSHVCTPMEIINTYNHYPSDVTSETGTVWVNSGTPGNITPAVTDCKGWTNSDNDPYYGIVWNFSSKASAIQPCGSTRAIACCK